MEKELMKVSNYARLKGVSTVYIYKLIKEKKVKSKNIDGVVFVVKED